MYARERRMGVMTARILYRTQASGRGPPELDEKKKNPTKQLYFDKTNRKLSLLP